MCGEDLVLCVPTKKGHQILYKGYTYIFKSMLPCGSEQWICSFRQKTVVILPDWLPSYFQSLEEDKSRCNLCLKTFDVNLKSPDLLDHLKDEHKDIYDLHENNPLASGYHIEFLNFNVVKQDEYNKDKQILLGEVIGATETVPAVEESTPEKNDEVGLQYVLIERRKKKRAHGSPESRRRSWVWKYFVKLSSIIYRCNLCNVLLSIKGCNTNNMNRHIRTRHPLEFKREVSTVESAEGLVNDEVETPYPISTEEIYASDRHLDNSGKEPQLSKSKKSRRSWIWSYFERITGTVAKCKICHRNINHGGNATGNMNRHLKIVHNKNPEEPPNSWVWKVIENNDDEDSYTCKICQYSEKKMSDPAKNMSFILQHLKFVHGVDSGDQIITDSDSIDV